MYYNVPIVPIYYLINIIYWIQKMRCFSEYLPIVFTDLCMNS